jgi:hypothetical protein
MSCRLTHFGFKDKFGSLANWAGLAYRTRVKEKETRLSIPEGMMRYKHG